jgi:F-type H+-transporting ATPase subunit epsilon
VRFARSTCPARRANSAYSLAEQAIPVEGLDPAVIVQAIQDTEEDIADAKDEAARDKARERLAQLNMLKSALGQ